MKSENDKTTILIADDHSVVRQGLAEVIHKKRPILLSLNVETGGKRCKEFLP